MIEHREIKLWFLAPGSDHRVIRGRFSHGSVRVREIRNIEQQIALPFFREIGLADELGDLITNLPHLFFERGAIFAPATRAPDFFAQSFPIRIALLEGSFHFSPLRIDLQYFIDAGFIAAATGREPALDEVGLFTNQTDIEHAQELSVLSADRKSKRMKARDFPRRRRIILGWTS